MNLVERVKNLIVQPRAEWATIAAEPHTLQELYTGYVMILAAIPPVAVFLGTSLVGIGFLGASYRVPIVPGVAQLVLSYLLALAMVYILALIIDALAPSFGGEKNFLQALKVAAFAPTASWIAGIFMIIPLLGILALLGSLYSLYLLYLGLPMLMRAPEDKAVPYTVVVILAAIVLAVVVGALGALVVPSPMRGF